MALRTNNAAGGTQGTTVTGGPGNSGGNSGDAFDSVTISATGALTFDNTHARGNFAYKISTGGTAGNSEMDWNTGITITTTAYWRGYLYFTAFPTVTHRFWFCGPGAATHCAAQIVLTTGLLRILNSAGTTIATTTNAVTLNQWIRVECSAVATATGTVTLKLYNNADSTTATETISGANSGGTTSITRTFAGVSGGVVANAGPFWMDEIAYGDPATFFGPSDAQVMRGPPVRDMPIAVGRAALL